MHSALPVRLLVDHTQVYILTDCEGGNPFSVPRVVGSLPQVAVDLGKKPQNQLNKALILKWLSCLVTLGDQFNEALILKWLSCLVTLGDQFNKALILKWLSCLVT